MNPMSAPSSLVYTPEQVRLLDRIAIEECGIPGYELMTRAGRFVFDLCRAQYPQARRWLVLCGAGNNAGDGYVVARLALSEGITVTVAALSEPRRLGGDAAAAWHDYQHAGGTVAQFSAGLCQQADLIVDALLGTGLTRSLEGAYLHAVESVNSAAAPVVAVDIPSGLCGLTGQVLGAAVCAEMTATFIGRKLGLYLGAGPELTGAVRFSDLGVPPDKVAHATPALRLFDALDHRRQLPPRARTAHKGQFGHVLVIGGNHGMGGAVRLAGEAALRSGAGLVSVATRADNVSAVTALRPELMCSGVESVQDLEPLLGRATVIAIGPGLGRDAWAREMLGRVLECQSQLLVVDADALNLLAEQPCRRGGWVLTPHPGEAGRLLGVDTAAIQADRLGAARQLWDRFGGVALLKGRGTLVGESGQIPYLIDAGNPGMASAGMGDVLTGLVSALIGQAQPADILAATACAAYIHAKAADEVARHGERGILATDVFSGLRPWLNPAM